MKRTKLIMCTLGLLLFAQGAQADWTAAKRLTWTASPGSTYPALAVDSLKNAHVVWQKEAAGNDEIYYLKGN